MSREWANEDICYGYRCNALENIIGRRIFLAYIDGEIVGYLFGLGSVSEKDLPTIPSGSRVFEVEELYVKPDKRSQGIGKALFDYCENRLAGKADYITLGTATKNAKSILHFYIDEVGMTFWSARLFKRLA